MRRTISRALVIVFGGAVLGLAVNAVSPRRIPYVAPPKPQLKAQDSIPLQEAQELWSSGAAFFFDARATADYVSGHIANAFSLPVEEFDQHYPSVAGMPGAGAVSVA